MIEPCLSICIPTNGRIEIVRLTLDSIYDNCTVPFSKFEVVLSDNSKNDDLFALLNLYKKYPNIVYKKTNCEGFLNSINALKMGKGSLLKLHNNYSMFTKDGLESLIYFVNKEENNKPLIFFRNSGEQKISYNTFDAFNCDLSYYNSWSSGFSIWKQDFDKISDMEVNKMFPHTSLFLGQYYKEKFILDKTQYFINQEVPGKGGYDLFKTFAVDYLKMIEEAKCKNYITHDTFLKIKKDLFLHFLLYWYYNTMIVKNDFTFHLQNIKQSIAVYYGETSYYKLIFYAHMHDLKIKIKTMLKNIGITK